jgi:hypothetical protein
MRPFDKEAYFSHLPCPESLSGVCHIGATCGMRPFGKEAYFSPLPCPESLSGVCETGSTCSICVGSIPFTFKAVREILNESDLGCEIASALICIW